MKHQDAAKLGAYLLRLFPLVSAERIALCEDRFLGFDAAVVREAIDQHRETHEHLVEPDLWATIRSLRGFDPVQRRQAVQRQIEAWRRSGDEQRAAVDADVRRVHEQLDALGEAEIERRRSIVLATWTGAESIRAKLARASPRTNPALAGMILEFSSAQK